MKLTLKMVKELKKDRYVNSQIQKNNYEDVSTNACEYCALALKSHKANVKVNKTKSHERCLLLKKMICYDMQFFFCHKNRTKINV